MSGVIAEKRLDRLPVASEVIERALIAGRPNRMTRIERDISVDSPELNRFDRGTRLPIDMG